jgi:hypothetical protein
MKSISNVSASVVSQGGQDSTASAAFVPLSASHDLPKSTLMASASFVSQGGPDGTAFANSIPHSASHDLPQTTSVADRTLVSYSEPHNYKGHIVDRAWLLNTYKNVLKLVNLGKRHGIKCVVCEDNVRVAEKTARNGKVPIADGIRADGKKELERVIDHLLSSVHEASLKEAKTKELWSKQSDKHPWIRVLKSANTAILTTLIELAIDVYNDSKQKTLSANSWPSRSLAHEHALNQINVYKDHGLNAEFSGFNPSSTALHYRNPVVYREMLQCVSQIELSNVVDGISASEGFAVQIDGSVDKYQTDNKFITIRYFDEDRAMKTCFLGEAHSDKRGAEGLLEALICRLDECNLLEVAKQKLNSLTTDGESANTGKKGGLWVKLIEYLGRDILCFWCICHRSDLVIDDMVVTVPELQQWKTNMKSVAAFYRASSVRTAELTTIIEEAAGQFFRFPEHHDIRFAEHLFNLAFAICRNLNGARKHWSSLQENGEGKEKATAKGFLKIWLEGGQQERLTFVMLDILRLLRDLQKTSQRSLITLPDILFEKDKIIGCLDLMCSEKYPGGFEERYSGEINVKDDNETQRCHNANVTSRRSFSAIRQEVVCSARNFLSKRLSVEQDKYVKEIVSFMNAQNSSDMINSVKDFVRNCFGIENLSKFCDDVMGMFAQHGALTFSLNDSGCAKLYEILRRSKPGSALSAVTQTFLTAVPHSMDPERMVSHHTELKSSKRSCTSRDTLNARLIIAINGTGTAHYDPRPAVALFLKKKDRRNRVPDEQLYKHHDFIKHFFSL